MAWTDQCKVAFCASAEHLIHRNGGKGVLLILRQLSKESGIPFNTLRNWWYASITENGNNPASPENSNSSINKNGGENEHPLCEVCGQRKVERNKRNGKWAYKRRCRECRKLASPAKVAQFYIFCPHCERKIILDPKDLRQEEKSNES